MQCSFNYAEFDVETMYICILGSDKLIVAFCEIDVRCLFLSEADNALV